MAVEFPSDLILDVARAADPSRVSQVANRLSEASAGGMETQVAGLSGSKKALSRDSASGDSKAIAKEFEALLVGNMIADMMGDAEESYYGGGFAGDVWKSMMTEQIAMAVVERGDFGIASTISGYFVRDGEAVEPVGGIADAASAPLENRAEDAARSGTQEISRDFVRKMLSLEEAGRGR